MSRVWGVTKVFSSKAYAHVPDQQRTKLEDKSKIFIFIGYDEKTKRYKLLYPISKKVIIKDGGSSIATPTIISTCPETTDDEDEP